MKLEYSNLIGKPWEPNKSDCFSINIDFFAQNFGIKIPNFARPNDWDADKLNLIEILYKQTGFIKLAPNWEELRPADVLATAVGSVNPNHLVIYLGNNEILHHKYGVNSCVETMRPIWRMITGYILRHPDVPDLRPVYSDITIEELLRARYKL